MTSTPRPTPASVPLAPLLAVNFIGTLGYSITIPFLVFVVADLGGNAFVYGLVGAAYSASQFVGAPILGRWSDRVGRVRVLAVSQAGTLLAWLIFALALYLPADTVGQTGSVAWSLGLMTVFAARVLDGLTGGNVSVANAYLADVSDDSNRQRNFGRMGMAAGLGFSLGPAIAGILGSFGGGYIAPVLLAALVSLIGLGLIARLPSPPSRCPNGPPPDDGPRSVFSQEARECFERPAAKSVGFRDALRIPGVPSLLLIYFLVFVGFNLFYAGFPAHASGTLGWSAGSLGAFFALMSVMMIAVQGPVLTWASARWSSQVLFSAGMATLGLGFVVFALAEGPWIYGGAGLFALGNGVGWPAFQAILAKSADGPAQGAVQGYAASAGALASVVGLIVGGALYVAFAGTLFWLIAGLFAAIALTYGGLRRARD